MVSWSGTKSSTSRSQVGVIFGRVLVVVLRYREWSQYWAGPSPYVVANVMPESPNLELSVDGLLLVQVG